MNLDTIINILHREGRAATYKAVAELVGTLAPVVMEGRPRDAKNSWVVNGMTLLPTHYEMHEMDNRLRESIDTHGVMRESEMLKAWIEETGIT